MTSLDGGPELAKKGRVSACGVRGMRHAERHVAGLVAQRQAGHVRGDWVRACRCTKRSSSRKVPSPSTDSRNPAVVKFGSSRRVCSEVRPSALEVPSVLPLPVAPQPEPVEASGHAQTVATARHQLQRHRPVRLQRPA